jgi:Raf kinase inhibitor-like YbhB/YbcL family protein
MAKYFLSALIIFIVISCGDTKNQNQTTNKNEEDTMAASGKFAITSTAFKEGEMIPQKYTCDGQNISPPLKWESIPAQTKSLALIVDDPDAPAGIWVHWVIFNIPPTATGLPENVPTKTSLADGSVQGKNDSREIGYDGPCPPGGTHRYYFKLYALDTMLKLSSGVTKPELLKAMEGHIVAQAQLMGRYSRK